ncbi:MAG: hypothetical protein C3F07_02090 [Anaerolineales bacterium]|nr:MAG: hypothetical protein C3F07_02090 [Anaerolineales bacterium]
MPDANRLGLLTATVLLAFALTRLLPSSEFNLEFQFPGFFFILPLNLTTAMTMLTAGLTATGMDWLLRGHPSLKGRATYQWWLLPTLTTFVIGVPLSILPNGAPWWIGFAISGTLLFFIFLAEYIVVDAGAPYYALSVAGLTAISYTLFFIFSAALRSSDARLFLILPALFITASLASLRILHLRIGGRWEFAWALGIGLVCIQLAAGLHYWPLSPVQFGLMLTGPLYALSNLAINLDENIPMRRAMLVTAIIAAVSWGLAVLF